MLKKIKLVRQLDKMDCALACLKMVAKFYEINNDFDTESYQYYTSKDGISLNSIIEIAKILNFNVVCGKITIEQLIDEALLPCILFWNKEHYIVLYKITLNRKKEKIKFYIADPDKGKLCYSYEDFMKNWICVEDEKIKLGITILLEPNEHAIIGKKNVYIGNKINNYSIKKFFHKNRKLFILLFLTILIGGVLELVFPFLTKFIVDIGIKNKDLKLIFFILLGQFCLLVGTLVNDFFRKWFILHIGYRFTIQLLSDLMRKMMKLPIRFFESKQIGDILQRLQDHEKIEKFITVYTSNLLFSIVTLISLSVVLVIFNIRIFVIYSIGSIIYVLWVSLFLNKRKLINRKMFTIKSQNQSKFHEIIRGINEIKIQNFNKIKSQEIEKIQEDLYKINIKGLKLDQYLESGNIFFNELKNILITFVSAFLVIKGELTLGMMLSIQYIIGQLNVPINQSITSLYAFQDAKLSMDRINDVFIKKEEKTKGIINEISSQSIIFSNLYFNYTLSESENVLENINIIIPHNKITAIVGTSGSGKTTLLKLLLKFYPPNSGTISVGNIDLADLDTYTWREKCGVVLQDGYIFADSIMYNIVLGQIINMDNLFTAAKIANIYDFIISLPFKFETQIGDNGINLSQGQKQRLLIARAIYKNPEYIFFDEATNALDANNEKVIVDNLNRFLEGKTSIIVAHRLSTVKNADLIIVMDKGKIVEYGTHTELLSIGNYYYQLIKNQLELGL